MKTRSTSWIREDSLAIPRRARTGATVLECAITLPVMFLVLFALLDLGLAATRYNSLNEAARRIAREAAIHGSLAPSMSTEWGPEEYEGTGADSAEIAAVARPMLIAMAPDDVAIRVVWPDNDNSPRDAVNVELNYRHSPMLPGLFVWGDLELRAVSTMRIVN